jgi:hypothetical protein
MAKQDLDPPQRASRPDWSYWDRPSARTDAEREAAFQRYIASAQNYFVTVESNSDKPWFDSIEERRELWFRRYQRPSPPAGLSIPNVRKTAA